MASDDRDMVLVRRDDLRFVLDCASDYDERIGECSPEAEDRLLAAARGASCERELSTVRLEHQATVRERDRYLDALREIADPPGPYGGCLDLHEARTIARAALNRERKDTA